MKPKRLRIVFFLIKNKSAFSVALKQKNSSSWENIQLDEDEDALLFLPATGTSETSRTVYFTPTTIRIFSLHFSERDRAREKTESSDS